MSEENEVASVDKGRDEVEAEVFSAAFLVREALRKAGPNPHYHHRLMARNRVEWPRLFIALDKLSEALDRLDSVEGRDG